MTFRDDLSRDSSRVRTSKGRKGAVAGVGGIGGLVLVALFLFLGGNPNDLDAILGGNQNPKQSIESGEDYSLDHCQTGADANQYDDCRVLYTAYSVDEVWSQVLPQQAGLEYTEPGVTIFQDSVQSRCGVASAATGPFYCPADNTVYLDVSFFNQLQRFGGTNAPLAQMYIVAHEFGHHIQNLEGTLGLSNYNDPGAESNAVKIELQADCYAGVWAHWADDSQFGDLQQITPEQLRTAVETAGAVGDDNIQRRSGGSVNPDSFTHGSSEQRQQMFMAGYRSGSMAQCDLLDRGVYAQ